jgi:hypothetical protein
MKRFILDSTRFPMVHIEPIGYFHFLPVTKVQFEYYVCDRPNPGLDQAWYKDVLQLNPRVSPGRVQASNFYGAFMTAVLPAEAEEFAEWHAEAADAPLDVPTADEWQAAYRSAAGQDPAPADDVLQLDLAPRARTLLEGLARVTAGLCPNGARLADRMFMRNGVMEWVRGDASVGRPWGAYGVPRFGGALDRTDPATAAPRWPADVHKRIRNYGFRLVRRP